MIDTNKVMTNFEMQVVLNYLLHIMDCEQRGRLAELFPVQYAKLFPTTIKRF